MYLGVGAFCYENLLLHQEKKAWEKAMRDGKGMYAPYAGAEAVGCQPKSCSLLRQAAIFFSRLNLA